MRKLIRKYCYPIYNQLFSIAFKLFANNIQFTPSLWLLGQRGNDYARHRARVNGIRPIRGKTLLIAGCGTGKDLYSWLGFRPKKIIGVDLFSYPEQWAKIKRVAENDYGVTVEFSKASLESLDHIGDGSVDIVASDAVFEHIKDLPAVLRSFERVLSRDGILYSTYGPLWHSFGGDHISGNDHLKNGYNHILLDPGSYNDYLATFGTYADDENDGRKWIKEDLFSRLKVADYYKILNSSEFRIVFDQLIIDPKAILYYMRYGRLSSQEAVIDNLISAMSVICVRK